MLFSFLRQYLKDDEFEELRLQLTECKSRLAEHKAHIQKQELLNEAEREKVDSDFLTLIWASIAVALAFGSESTKHLLNNKILFTSLNNTIWSIFVFVAFLFSAINLFVAINLTLKYAHSKNDGNVKTFAFTLLVGMFILIIGMLVISFPQ